MNINPIVIAVLVLHLISSNNHNNDIDNDTAAALGGAHLARTGANAILLRSLR